MTGFVVGALLLLLLAAAIILLRRHDDLRPADAQDPNLDWYRQRQRELERLAAEGGDAQLLEEAQLRLLEDGGLRGDTVTAGAAAGRFPRLLLVAAVVLLSSLIYLQTGALEDVLISRDLITLSADDGDAARRDLLRRIEARSDARQGNLQYLSLLGQLYMAGEDFRSASSVYTRLAEKAPEDSQALAMAAQARFLAAGRRLDQDAQRLAERALAIDPVQRTALSMLGMASFESGAYDAAVSYWERLLEQEPPGSQGYQMLAGIIAMARERGGLPAQDTGVPDAVATGDAPGISVALSLAGESPDPQATVFVFARPADRGGMPVAVRRLRAADLPLTLRLEDSDAMAGQRLSEAGAVLVSAQLSANGQPGLANALFSGSAGPVTAGGSEAAVTIELRSAPEPG